MNEGVKKSAMRRLKILEGQIRGLQNMIEKEKYCIDILHQSAAVKEALSGVENLILESHLSTHVVEQMKKGKEKKATQEILDIYRLSRKRQ